MDTKYTTDSVTTEFTFSEQHDELGSIWLKYYLHAFGDNQKQIDITIYSMNRMHMPGYIFKGSFVDLVGLILKVKYPPVALGNNAEVIEKAMKNRIKEFREKACLSQAELARRVHVASPNLSAVENGHRVAWPKLRRRLARSLNTTQEELFPAEKGVKMQDNERLTRELIPDTCPHCERDLDVNIPGIIEALTVSRSADLPGQSDSQTK